jgi:hypothetical protein
MRIAEWIKAYEDFRMRNAECGLWNVKEAIADFRMRIAEYRGAVIH